MKTWTEYSASIEDYYEWVSRSNNKVIKKMGVLSFNCSGIDASNIDEFYQYCRKELYRTLKYPEKYNIYIIVNERIINGNSKVEHYKKCWKKVASKFDISKFELANEIGYEYGEHFFYAGIAKTSIANIIDVMKIANGKPNKCILFVSKGEYLKKSYMDSKFIESYIAYDQYGDIDYTKCFAQCSLNHDLGIRYGKDSTGAELAVIFNCYDVNELLNYNEK